LIAVTDRFDLHPSAWIAPGAILLGDVQIGAHSSVWFQCVLRGDVDAIHIGPDCNIQDGTVLHTMAGYPLVMGARVTLGHCVMAHGCTLGDDVMVGIRATILNGARIGNRCLIAAGSLVTENMVIPDDSLVMGAPAKVVKAITSEHLALIQSTAAHYVDYSRAYQRRFPTWDPLP
jgi:carbonic anhydrase/acetyltransferase-like protein (isoleucine patch superfamily)